MTETRNYLSISDKGCRRGKDLEELKYVCIHEAPELLSPHTLRNDFEEYPNKIGAHVAIGHTGDVVYMAPFGEQIVNIGTFNVSKKTGEIVDATDKNTVHIYVSPYSNNKLFSNMSMISLKAILTELFADKGDRDWRDIVVTKWSLFGKEPTPFWWSTYPSDLENFFKFLEGTVELTPELVPPTKSVVEQNGPVLSDPVKGPYLDIAHWCPAPSESGGVSASDAEVKL